MKIHKFDYSIISQFSIRDKEYAKDYNPLVGRLPYSSDYNGLKQSLITRVKSTVNRNLLGEVLLDQYDGFTSKKNVLENISLLKKTNTFSVTTAHQPVIFLGPLYVIYKAISAIKVAEQVQRENPNYNIVPVFVIGGEDHDFDEMSETKIFGKTIKWNFDSEGKSVGNINPSNILELCEEVKLLFERDVEGFELVDLITKVYDKNTSYTRATQEILHELLGAYGLVTIDMSDKRLKSSFSDIIKKEILEEVSMNHVLNDQNELQKLGYSPQAHVRPINFFYHSDLGRKLIFKSNNDYHIDGTDISFNSKELVREIDNHPENFSPNVVMRPIYQSFILPDIAYVGGGGELAYWMERTSQFKAFNIHFPVLLRRFSSTILFSKKHTQFLSLGFEFSDVLKNVDILKKEYVTMDEGLSFVSERDAIKEMMQKLEDKLKTIDTSLVSKLKGFEKSSLNTLSDIEKRAIKSLKQKNLTQMNKIEKLKNELHPDKGLQERSENLLSFYSRSERPLIELLMEIVEVIPTKFNFIEI